SFSFSYTTTAVLNSGTVVNLVTVSGHDDENTPASATDTATLTVADVAPSISVDKGVANIAEGNAATYSFTMTNASSASTDSVTITSVVHDKLCDLTSAALAARGSTPTRRSPDLTFTFSYTTTAVLNAGTVVNVVTVSGHDDENTTASATDTATL